jgi:hypothetical protein
LGQTNGRRSIGYGNRHLQESRNHNAFPFSHPALSFIHDLIMTPSRGDTTANGHSP